MPGETRTPPITAQHWPCGPECRHAQPMPNTYGEWHWCTRSQFGGQLVRDGHECTHYQAAALSADRPEPARQ